MSDLPHLALNVMVATYVPTRQTLNKRVPRLGVVC
jgi:hypothetical protein